MSRVTIVGAREDRDAVLKTLRSAAVVDVDAPDELPAEASELRAQRDRVRRVRARLGGETTAATTMDPEHAAAVVERAEQVLGHIDALATRLTALEDERRLAVPWADVDPEDLRWLERQGVVVGVHRVGRGELDADALDELAWASVRPRGRGRVEVITVSPEPDEGLPLPVLELPPRALAAVEQDIDETRTEHGRLTARLEDLRTEAPRLSAYEASLDDRIEYLRVRQGTDTDPRLFTVEGHCATRDLPVLRGRLAEETAVLLVGPPGVGTPVPVALDNPPVVRTFEPLVAAFKLPSYGELDPTPLIAPFMGLFFGFCLGDLGYGLVLTGLSWAALAWGRPSGDLRVLLRWAVVLGLCTMGIGALLGNVFGVRMHEWLDLPADALLFTLVDRPEQLFYASLGFGVVQLGLGMAIRLGLMLRQRRLQAALGALAWLLVIPTLSLALIGTWPWWPFAAVCLTLLVFAAPERGLGPRLGGGLWALYNVSGLLGNVASYARIFGLGLSSGIIAMVVNTIAATLADGVLGTIAAAVVLVLGHAFNFAMAVIGSVVHPARLQLLEFLDTFFEGGGRPFAPFTAKYKGDA
ncbi:MAG: hypothetical protein AAF799_00370 [Myxococcota bacterium]